MSILQTCPHTLPYSHYRGMIHCCCPCYPDYNKNERRSTKTIRGREKDTSDNTINCPLLTPSVEIRGAIPSYEPTYSGSGKLVRAKPFRFLVSRIYTSINRGNKFLKTRDQIYHISQYLDIGTTRSFS